jgi:hypothetical protein
MSDEKEAMKPGLAKDGVHPTAQGYAIMGPLAEAAIAKALKITRCAACLFGTLTSSFSEDHDRRLLLIPVVGFRVRVTLVGLRPGAVAARL